MHNPSSKCQRHAYKTSQIHFKHQENEFTNPTPKQHQYQFKTNENQEFQCIPKPVIVTASYTEQQPPQTTWANGYPDQLKQTATDSQCPFAVVGQAVAAVAAADLQKTHQNSSDYKAPIAVSSSQTAAAGAAVAFGSTQTLKETVVKPAGFGNSSSHSHSEAAAPIAANVAVVAAAAAAAVVAVEASVGTPIQPPGSVVAAAVDFAEERCAKEEEKRFATADVSGQLKAIEQAQKEMEWEDLQTNLMDSMNFAEQRWLKVELAVVAAAAVAKGPSGSVEPVQATKNCLPLKLKDEER